MLNKNDKVTDVIAVLINIHNESKKGHNYHNITELRKNAVKSVAESELRKKRYKNEDSAQKTIHDACTRRLKPDVVNIAVFDSIVDQWLRQSSMRLKEILLGHSLNRSQQTEINRFFENKL